MSAHRWLAALEGLPADPRVASFDEAVEGSLQRYLRGRPALDRVMYAASAAGEHSLVWLALAGLEGTLRRRPLATLGRAGALLGTESALVNGAVKSLFRRRRPSPPEEHPHHLRQPRTSSFPSGHASSAFFAAAMLRDSPLAPAYYALAVVIAASRAHVRLHHASDVLAGAVVGAVMGEVARRVAPLALSPRGGTGNKKP